MKTPIPYKFASRTAKFFWKKNIITTLSAAIIVGIIVGTSILNDSIEGSMRVQTATRLGKIVSCLSAPNDFRAELATDITVGQQNIAKKNQQTQNSEDEETPVVVATLRYQVALQSIIDKQNQFTLKSMPYTRSATLWGIDDNFIKLESSANQQKFEKEFQLLPKPNEATINASTAKAWNIQQGDIIAFTIDTPGDIPLDSPLSKKNDLTRTLSVTVTHIVPDDSVASVSLSVSQKPVRNIFVNLEWLQKKLDLVGRANTLFSNCDITYNYHPVLDDYGFQLHLTDLGFWTVSSRKMAFSEQEREALLDKIHSVYDGQNIEISSSIVAMINRVSIKRVSKNPQGRDAVSYVFLAATDDKKVPYIQPGQTAITQWLADQMKLKIGDTLCFQYFITDKATGKLTLKKREWQVGKIIKEDELFNDTSWIPHIPGVSKKPSMDSWEAKFVSETCPILPADEDHWSMYGAIPKVFINLEEARTLFSSRHGTITSVRVWSKTMPKSSDLSPLPQDVGWTFTPIREHQMRSSSGAYDFPLFFMLVNIAPIVGTIAMMILFMRLNLAYRCKTIGLLQALGWTPSTIRKTFICENAIISTVGSVIGIIVGIVLATAGIIALNLFGQDVIGTPFLHFHASIYNIIIFTIIGWAITFLASIFCIRRIDTIRSLQRLRGYFYHRKFYSPSIGSNIKACITQCIFWLLIISLAFVVPVLDLVGVHTVRVWTPTVLFSIAILALITGIITYYYHLTSFPTSGLSYDFYGSVRTPKRSVIIMGVVASMTLLIPALSVFLLNIENCEQQTIKNNGEYRFVIKTAIPIYENINTPTGRDRLNFSFEEQEILKYVDNIDQAIIRDGDDASLDNLYYPYTPKIIGLSSGMLKKTNFAWRSAMIPTMPWEALSKKEYAYPLVQMQEIKQELQTEDPDVIAIQTKQAMLTHVLTFVGDYNTLKNRYHLKGLDSRLILDERPGREVQGRVVAVLDNDMFHGCLVTSEENLRYFFPETDGYQMFFVDCPEENVEQVQKALLEALALYGPEIETSYQSHVQQAVVHNGWIHLAQVWLLLGFALCSCGFYPLLKRNILIRKSELATLFTLGMTIAQLKKTAIAELFKCYNSGIKTGTIIAVGIILTSVLVCHNLDLKQLIWTCSIWLVCTILTMCISSITCRLATRELKETALIQIIKKRE